jgi:hypothetical protein
LPQFETAIPDSEPAIVPIAREIEEAECKMIIAGVTHKFVCPDGCNEQGWAPTKIIAEGKAAGSGILLLMRFDPWK